MAQYLHFDLSEVKEAVVSPLIFIYVVKVDKFHWRSRLQIDGPYVPCRGCKLLVDKVGEEDSICAPDRVC